MWIETEKRYLKRAHLKDNGERGSTCSLVCKRSLSWGDVCSGEALTTGDKPNSVKTSFLCVKSDLPSSPLTDSTVSGGKNDVIVIAFIDFSTDSIVFDGNLLYRFNQSTQFKFRERGGEIWNVEEETDGLHCGVFPLYFCMLTSFTVKSDGED